MRNSNFRAESPSPAGLGSSPFRPNLFPSCEAKKKALPREGQCRPSRASVDPCHTAPPPPPAGMRGASLPLVRGPHPDGPRGPWCIRFSNTFGALSPAARPAGFPGPIFGRQGREFQPGTLSDNRLNISILVNCGNWVKKRLEEPAYRPMFRPPFDSWAVGKNRSVRRIKAASSLSSVRLFW
jgi:hypothetical protein